MGCHLHELLNNPEANIMIRGEMKDSEFIKMCEILRSSTYKAICFDMGEIGDICRFQNPKMHQFLDLPYENCWFESHFEFEGNSVIIGLLTKVQDKTTYILAFRKKHNAWMARGFIETESIQAESFGICPPDVIYEMKQHRLLLLNFLALFSCNNIIATEKHPSKILQKKRKKKGKQTHFSYWVLEINMLKESSNKDLGGTHASPRAHLRRGHVRQYAPGKFTWVQSCAVGKAPGTVEKSYRGKYPKKKGVKK